MEDVPPTVDRLTETHSDEIVSVLCDAFRDYPVMRFVIGQEHPDDEDRLRRLISYFVFRRVQVGGPLLGIRDTGSLVAAAVMTRPAEPESPPDVIAHRDALWRTLGEDAQERYERYAQATKAFVIDRPHHHLNMIGVRRTGRGRGFGRLLLDAVVRLSREDAVSCGVSLTTETPANVALYEHVGYRVIGRAHVAPELETWGMFFATRDT